MPKVSVVSGYYNRRNFLEATVISILEQSFTDLELIIFDDASTDGTGDALLELAQRLGDPRLKAIVHDTNMGFTRGMISAVQGARGEYIAVQGSGDISHINRIEKQNSFLDDHEDVSAVGCYYTNIVADSGVRRARAPNPRRATLQRLINGDNIYSHGEVMFRKSIYDDVGGYRAAFVNSQDIDLWLRMVRRGRLEVVPEQLYDRYVRMDGVSYSPKKFSNQARYSMLARRFAKLETAELTSALNKLEEFGPGALVPQDDPELQKRYIRAAIRSIIWGASAEAEDLISENVCNVGIRTSLLAASRALKTPLGSPFLSLVRRAFKVD